MHRNSPTDDRNVPARFLPSPIAVGTACCVFAALGYTAVNICLRRLTVKYDPAWVLCMKEVIGALWIAPWLVWQAIRGRRSLPTGNPLVALVVVGLLTHLVGNLPLIWAMGVVGLAITVPVSLGVNLVACAVMGRMWLRERVTPQSALALGTLVLSVVVLTAGASRANDSMSLTDAVATGPFWVFLAVAASCAAGLVFGLLNVTLRSSAGAGVPLAALGFMVPAMGAVSLLPLCLLRHGLPDLLATAAADLALMLFCGTLNIAAFLSIIKGLQLTTVLRANVLSASQVAMAALAGLLFFGEGALGVSPSLVVGIALTIAGTVLIDRPS